MKPFVVAFSLAWNDSITRCLIVFRSVDIVSAAEGDCAAPDAPVLKAEGAPVLNLEELDVDQFLAVAEAAGVLALGLVAVLRPWADATACWARWAAALGDGDGALAFGAAAG